MKRPQKIFLQIIFLALIIFFGGKYLGRNNPSSLFKVTDVSDRIKFTEHKDFSGAIVVNLDDDPEKEIYVGSYGTSNLLLKRYGNELRPFIIRELEDPEGLTFAVAACDIDRDGRDEIFL